MKISRQELAEDLANRLTDAVSMDELEQFYFDYHRDFYLKEADADHLFRDARDLGLLEAGETLEIED